MTHFRMRLARVSPALVVSVIALFVALAGTAGAAEQAAVPLAKRALVADNAKKLGGLTAKQLGTAAATAAVTAALNQSPAGPRPATTAASLVTIKTGTGQIAAGAAQNFTVVCDAGQKVMGGGFASDKLVLGFDSYPSNDTTWSLFLGNADNSGAANVNLYATCLK